MRNILRKSLTAATLTFVTAATAVTLGPALPAAAANPSACAVMVILDSSGKQVGGTASCGSMNGGRVRVKVSCYDPELMNQFVRNGPWVSVANAKSERRCVPPEEATIINWELSPS